MLIRWLGSLFSTQRRSHPSRDQCGQNNQANHDSTAAERNWRLRQRGLDPVGRKEVRDLILEERKAGRTIFFSTHILSDVETLCDHVTILRQGNVVVSGRLAELLKSDVKRTDVVLVGADEAFEARLGELGHRCRRAADRLIVEIEGQARVSELLRLALDAGVAVAEVTPRHETLEDLFVREAIDETAAGERRAEAGANAPA